MSAEVDYIAHRGYSGRYPENTLLAYEKALEAGARLFELDIQLSADRVPFLHHDKTLERMAGVDADFRDLEAHDIKRLSAAYPERFGDQFSDNGFTTFNKFCRWLKHDERLRTFVEIKQESIDRWGIPRVVDAVLKRIERHGVAQQCVMISFNPEVVEYTRQVSDLECGWVLPEWNQSMHDIAKTLNPEFLFCWTDILPADNASVWQGDWQWALYNLDDLESAQAMVDRGFRYLETNEIGTLLA